MQLINPSQRLLSAPVLGTVTFFSIAGQCNMVNRLQGSDAARLQYRVQRSARRSWDLLLITLGLQCLEVSSALLGQRQMSHVAGLVQHVSLGVLAVDTILQASHTVSLCMRHR